MNYNEIYNKLNEKLSVTAKRGEDKIPYTAVNGVHDNKIETDICWWTNGFWPAIMWQMYAESRNEQYLITARKAQKALDGAFAKYDELHHDVGFMWYLSCGSDYILTGNKEARLRTLYAANLLAGRYNIKGGFIRAWNEDKPGWSIIDCMMNIPILYWASKEIGDDRYKHIAMAHADMTIRDHIRPDGSVNHIVVHDLETGEATDYPMGQGYASGSSWSRGQAWAIYGFAQSYVHTGKKEYLDAAKKAAHYFLANTVENPIPVSDFRAPKEPAIIDTTAAAIAACGFIETAKAAEEFEKDIYLNAAKRIIDALCENYCDFTLENDSIVQMGNEAYHSEKGQLPIIYGDYYFIEAVRLLCGRERIN